jgi:pimeloyl-ACP methyl ester carboxylesterase
MRRCEPLTGCWSDRVTTPEQANVLADSLQRATVAIIDGIGHWSAVEASADVSRLISEFMHDQCGPAERGEFVR